MLTTTFRITVAETLDLRSACAGTWSTIIENHKEFTKSSTFLQDFLYSEKVKQSAILSDPPFFTGQALFDPRCFDRVMKDPNPVSGELATHETFLSSWIMRRDVSSSGSVNDIVLAGM